MMHASASASTDATKLDAACAKAMEYQLAGQSDEAGRLYRAILQLHPQHAAANYCLGMLEVQAQRPLDALPFLKAALQAELEIPDYWLGYMEALTLAGRTTAARNILTLGRQQGIEGAAVEEFARRLEALSRQAGSEPPALSSVPQVAALRNAPKATRTRKQERAIRKEEALLLSMVGEGKNEAALALARRLTEQCPDRGLGWKIRGALMPTRDGYESALEIMQTAVHLLPEDTEAHVNLGVTLAKMHRFREAEAFLHRALELNPHLSATHFRLGMTFELQGRYAEAEESLRRGRALHRAADAVAGDDEKSYSHLLFIMSHNPQVRAEELFAEHRRYGEYVEAPLRAGGATHANERSRERRLKIGFLSGDLYEHSVGQFLEPILARLAEDPTLELHAYCTNPQQDALSRRLQTHFISFTAVGALTDGRLAEKIKNDRIDVLIDLSGHTGHNRLPVFARKPAPVQASWLGYPGTTGLQAMDYYLADRQWLPPGQLDHLFTEKLIYLPDRWAFKPHAAAPPVGPLPALASGHLTFGSFHRLGKINAWTIHLWSTLLLALPQAKLLVLGIPVDGPEKQLLEQFAAHGIAPERLICHGRSTMDVYLAFHNQVDIALDTLPYAGATTTMHSLSMGVPTLTVAGETSQARAGAGILANIGLDAFIADDAADFLAKARYWAAHLAELAELRSTLRSRLLQSPAGQPPLIAEHLARALRHMWLRWCDSRPNAAFATVDLPVRQPLRPARAIHKRRPYVVLAPPYDHRSAGIRVMHNLCDELNKCGYTAHLVMFRFKPEGIEFYTPKGDAGYCPQLKHISRLPRCEEMARLRDLIDDAYVIYPEVIPGNPLRAPRVVRYVLNSPAANGYPMLEQERDFIVSFSKHYWAKPNLVATLVDDEPLFNDRGTRPALERGMDCTYIGKGEKYGACFKIPGSVQIDRSWPADKESLAVMLRNTRYFLTWDLITQTNADALFCGAIPVVLRLAPFTDAIFDTDMGPAPYAHATLEGGKLSIAHDPVAFDAVRQKFMAAYASATGGRSQTVERLATEIERHFRP